MNRCTTPGCGRFVGRDEQRCRAHEEPELPSPKLIDRVLQELQGVLERLMNQIDDAEIQARHTPRISSAIFQGIRLRHQLSDQSTDTLLDHLADLMRIVDEEAAEAPE